jgi:hypothetical protein
MHPAAVAYLDTLLRPTDIVIEHGSGGSTLWLAERVMHVHSIEDKLPWYQSMSTRIPHNVTLYLRQDGSMPDCLPLGDVVIVDGEPVASRAVWLTNIFQVIKPGGIVVLDNSNRPDVRIARDWLNWQALMRAVIDVRCPNANYPITDFYRMPGGEVTWI